MDIDQAAKELDMLLIILNRARLWRYYTASDLQKKIPALRLYTLGGLINYLEILSDGSYVLIRRKKGVPVYKHNYHYYNRTIKSAKKISYEYKTDEERRVIKEREYEHNAKRAWKLPILISLASLLCSVAIPLYIYYADAIDNIQMQGQIKDLELKLQQTNTMILKKQDSLWKIDHKLNSGKTTSK